MAEQDSPRGDGVLRAMSLPARAARGLVHVIIDTPRGSGNKYKYDADYRIFKLSRILPLGMHFPYDFGSIPGTAAADGDALDVVLIAEHPSFVGCLMTVRLIGVLEAEQTEKRRTIRNDRLLAVAQTEVNTPNIREIHALPKTTLDHLEAFFVGYNRAHGRQFRPIGRRGPQAAERLLTAAIRLFEQQRR